MQEALKPLANRKGLYLEMQIGPDVGQVISDRRRVQQILINVVNNAVKFTDEGGVRVVSKIEDGWLVTTVSDTGIGFAAGDQKRLFEAFQQIETGLSRRYEGTGLGLSVCKKLLKLLGVKSTPPARAPARAALSPLPYRLIRMGSMKKRGVNY